LFSYQIPISVCCFKTNGIPTGWRAEMLSLVGAPLRGDGQMGKVLEQIASFEPN